LALNCQKNGNNDTVINFKVSKRNLFPINLFLEEYHQPGYIGVGSEGGAVQRGPCPSSGFSYMVLIK